MSFRVIVYFSGPKTVWSGKIDRSEVIFDAVVPWLWVARKHARNFASVRGNTGRCGYMIFQGEIVIDEQPATARTYKSI